MVKFLNIYLFTFKHIIKIVVKVEKESIRLSLKHVHAKTGNCLTHAFRNQQDISLIFCATLTDYITCVGDLAGIGEVVAGIFEER